ncbi:MAG: nucleotidyltransferase domain-containing protein [Candidatus Methanoplasma sp.]|jgi:predicted nucleotidyltransferase|nr:nucleotidyltransferase domain-containing protein [Candidatus Methanoplasma sp.]
MMFDYDSVDMVVEKIAKAFNPERIVVFGSVARHEADADSDLDLLVVMDTDLPCNKREAALRREVRPSPFPMDIIVQTPDEFADAAGNERSFISSILKDGVIAYES